MIVCTDKRKRGLGIRSLSLLNRALLGKWIWRYVFYDEVFWKQIIEGKCGKEGVGWCPCEVGVGYGVGVFHLLGRGEIFSLEKPPLKWVMTKGLSLGWIDGVQRSPCVIPFLLCMCWLCQRRSGWQNCGKT